MSGTKYSIRDNDTDILVTHWLLIVICALTVYFGRKYCGGLVINKGIGISHAVSRRRRILRDPVSRRPPPLLTYVQLNEADDGNARKSHVGACEEDAMPNAGRRIPRSSRQNAVGNVPLVSNHEGPKYSAVGGLHLADAAMLSTPKHIPFPNIPIDGDCFFELLMFVFTTAAAGLQFLQIYRTTWWLPNAHTHHAMNFYLIDIHLVMFILVLFARRLIYMLGCLVLQKLTPQIHQTLVIKIYRISLLTIIFTELILCGYFIVQTHPLVNIFYLCYPVSVYVILFGLTISPFFELIGWSHVPGLGGKPLHSCSSDATTIRTEVENLKTDFNNRMKQVLFSSVLNAYYAGFVPCCFAQSFVYYDVYGATLHLVFVGVGCFTMYAGHILPMRYCDVLHRSALHLGSWQRVEPRAHLPVAYNWGSDTLWPAGSLVRYSRELYRAQSNFNAAEPGNTTHARFHSIFKNPSVALSGLVCLQLSLVVVQLALLVRSSQWYQVLSLSLLLFVNYYTLFKLGRDYLITLKVYKTEQAIHEKNMYQ